MSSTNITEFNTFDDFMDHIAFKIIHGILYPTMVLIGYMGDVGKLDISNCLRHIQKICLCLIHRFSLLWTFWGRPSKKIFGQQATFKSSDFQNGLGFGALRILLEISRWARKSRSCMVHCQHSSILWKHGLHLFVQHDHL